ncbi:MAG: Gfo/Idh/MocA family oxidoreductase [Bacteroidales bacterium]|nr:Gfo/Idh/MocA family oxidoreductase [Bacteroidales bacterium]
MHQKLRPVRIGVAGLSHSHVLPLLRNLDRKDIQIVGIAERDTALSHRYSSQFKIDQNLIYESLDEMLDKTKPDGVITFTSIFEHLKVVEACAPRGIHVMVEKLPLSLAPFSDPFTFFASAIKGEIKIKPTDLASPEIQIII